MPPQPVEDRGFVAASDQVLDRPQFGCHRLTQLGADQVAQGIGGEISEKPFAPVDILKTAFGVVARTPREQLLHAVVPVLRQLLDRQVLLEQGQLQFKAQHDVEAVAEFIGLHPRQSGPHRIDAAPEAAAVAPGIAAQG